MKITFLDLSASYSHASLALPMLHLACDDIDAEWSVVRGTINDTSNDLVANVVSQTPALLLGTLYLFNHAAMVDVLQRVHVLLPDCVILLGGPEFAGDNRRFLQANPWVDGVVRGEGEGVLPVLLETLADGQPLSAPGLCSVDASGTYVDGGDAPRAPFPPARLPVESEFYDTSKAFVQIESSRDCSQGCRFCTSAHTGTPRWLPMDKLEWWLEQIKDKGVTEVRLLDRTFNASPKHAAERLALFRNTFPKMRFHLEIHPGFMPETLRMELAMAAPGQLHVEAGIQATQTHVMAACGRSGSSESALEGLEFLCSLPNLELHADLIAGLPEQTAADVREDIRRLSAIGPEEIQLETLKILPGTELNRSADALGLTFTPAPPYDVLKTPTLEFAELRSTMALSRVIDRFYNAPMLHPVIQSLGARSDGLLMTVLDELTVRGCADAPMSLSRRGVVLHEVLMAVEATTEAERLAYQWLSHGLSPAQCPGKPSRWRDEIPPDATVVVSLPGIVVERAQLWLLEASGSRCLFLFDRGVSQSAPAAIYELQSSRVIR